MNKNHNILIFRIIVCCTGWLSILITMLLNIESILNGSDAITLYSNTFSYYTIQSNILVATWLTLAVAYHNRDEKPSYLSSPIQGALTLYITITFLVFAILLSSLYQPTGWAAVTNITMHYAIPIAFIIDWLITSTKVQYRWIYTLYWLVYPTIYLVYTLIRGFFTHFYPYHFLSLNILTVPEFIISIIFLFGLFFLLGCLYTLINKVIFTRIRECEE